MYDAFKHKENTAQHKNNANHTIGNNNGYINSNAILNQNGNDSHTWLPLLNHHHHKNDMDPDTFPATNNNKWPVLATPNTLSKPTYVWRELPQDDESMGLFKPNLNTSNGLTNGNGLRSGHPDKNEHESLTGIVRHPITDYPNDSYEDPSNCGIGFCKPKWARKLASTHVFMVVFLLAWILQVRFFAGAFARDRFKSELVHNRVEFCFGKSLTCCLFFFS